MIGTRAIRRVPSLALVMILLGIITAACALPVDHEPRAIETDRLPSLLAQTSSTTTTIPRDSEPVNVYFVQNETLVAVPRLVRSRDPAELLDQLALGPTATEQEKGISGSVPPDTKLLGSSISDRRLTLDVSQELLGIGSPNDKIAFGQIVVTMVSADPTINKVSIRIEGKPTKIPTDDGLVDEAGSSRFLKLINGPETSTTTAPPTTVTQPPPD